MMDVVKIWNAQSLIFVHVLMDGVDQIVQLVWLSIIYTVSCPYYYVPAICDGECGKHMACTKPNTCICIDGWSGSNCSTGMLQLDTKRWT